MNTRNTLTTTQIEALRKMDDASHTSDPVVWTIRETTGCALEKRGLAKSSFRRRYASVGFSITEAGRAALAATVAVAPSSSERAVLQRAAENLGGEFDVSIYTNVFQRAAESACDRGWLKPSARGRRRALYTITDEGRAVLTKEGGVL